MLQAVIRKGQVIAENVPTPIVSDGTILIKVINSCISAGTEVMGVKETGKSLINRALEQPQNVKKIIKMSKTNGITETISNVKGKLDAGNPTGYSVSGIIVAVGNDIKDYKKGDRVAAAGAGYANHAEYVNVPKNLVMKMPENLSFENASTVTLGGIALQGVRRANLELGEFCVVLGVGILGLLAVQILNAKGVRVIAIDLDDSRLKTALDFGAEIVCNSLNEDVVKKVINHTGGFGSDAVIFTAATNSSEPLSDSFKMSKKKGKVVLVGVSGMNIKRDDIYLKELDFKVSTSYGPGRYDTNYEEKGIDYPYAYVRWTENRNMAEYLRLLSVGAIKLEKLINAKFCIEDVNLAFDALKSKDDNPLMIILDYKNNLDNTHDNKKNNKIYIDSKPINNSVINVALIGAGGFAIEKHLPNIKSLNKFYNLYCICNRTGLKGKNVGKQFGANYVTTDYQDVLDDENVDLIMIVTSHKEHESMVISALESGKNVFVEKPLATSRKGLELIKDYYNNNSSINSPKLFVGYNRRFSAYAKEIKTHTKKRINPLFISYRMNAGFIPLDHWIHEDGGRMVGEACHIIDLMTFLTESKIKSVKVETLEPNNQKYSSSDNKSIILKYEDGSVCNINYFAVGSSKLDKEYMEIHFDEKSIVLHNYQKLTGYGIKLKKINTKQSEKGHKEELIALHNFLKKDSNDWPIELWDIVQTSEISFNVI